MFGKQIEWVTEAGLRMRLKKQINRAAQLCAGNDDMSEWTCHGAKYYWLIAKIVLWQHTKALATTKAADRPPNILTNIVQNTGLILCLQRIFMNS